MPTWFRFLASRPATVARLLLLLLMVGEAGIAFFGPDVKAAKEVIARAEAAHEKTPGWEPDADVGIHLAALANLGLFAILALTAGWWTRPFNAAIEEEQDSRLAMPWWRRFAVPLGVMLVAALYGYGGMSFASKSLWWDEMWAVKQCSLGTWKPDKKNPEELKFQPSTWKKCAFYYQKPTNHVPMSLLQKASLTVWQKLWHKKPHEFTELVIRMPALLASGIAICLLIRLCGLARGTPLAALMLFWHPMHLHYGVDARAYALIVPLCLSAILAERRIMFTRGRKLWPWVWLALNQAAWIWTYPNAVLDVLALFIVLGVFLWKDEASPRDRVTAMLRLVVTHAFAAAIWLQLFLPNLLQARRWAGKEDQGHELDGSILLDTLSQLAFGMNWGSVGGGVEAQGLTSLVQTAGSPGLGYVLLALFFGLSLTGIVWAVRHIPRTGWLLAAPLLSSAAYAVLGSALGIYFYPRFVIACLPVLVAGLAVCPQAFTLWSQRHRFMAYAIIVLYLVPTAQQRALLRTRPYSAGGNAAQWIKDWTAQHSQEPKPLVVCYGLGREVMSVYYPAVQSAVSGGELDALKNRAKAEGRALMVIQGYSVFNRTRLPDGMQHLDNRGEYAELAAWPGMEADYYYRVLKAL